jgi:hypothetical protein
LIDFWSIVLEFFNIKKAPNISRLDVGVDPVEVRENPDPLLVRKKRPISRFSILIQCIDYQIPTFY